MKIRFKQYSNGYARMWIPDVCPNLGTFVRHRTRTCPR